MAHTKLLHPASAIYRRRVGVEAIGTQDYEASTARLTTTYRVHSMALPSIHRPLHAWSRTCEGVA